MPGESNPSEPIKRTSGAAEVRPPMTDAEYRALLSPEAYQVTRRKGTERAFSGAYWNTKEKGVYRCVCCGQPLFASDAKFDSGTGWPSFWEPIAPTNVATEQDRSLFMRRVEVLCGNCQAHLGHVFDDGPQPTGLRYCINSVSLKFEPHSGEKPVKDSRQSEH